MKTVCVLASNFFNLIFCALLHTNSKTHDVMVRSLLLSGDCDLFASLEAKLQRSVDLFAKDSTNVCLNVFLLKKNIKILFSRILLLPHALVWTILLRKSRCSALSGLIKVFVFVGRDIIWNYTWLTVSVGWQHY